MSFLDRLQKDAHASEMDHTNTSPAFFLLLSLLQIPVTQLIGWSVSWHFQLAAFFCIASHWLGFVIAMVIQSDKYFDITEDISYFAIILWSYWRVELPSTRQNLLFGAALLWCMRLCAFVGYRILVRGSDWRFDKLMKAVGYNFFGWTSGGTWCFLNGWILWANSSESTTANAPLDSLDYLGLAMFATGLAIETVSDIQKYQFNAAHKSGTNKSWIAQGLWKYSRHPNYFGEMLLWTGLAIASIGGWTNVTITAVLFAAITPVWSLFFLLFTSLMLLEKRADKKWGGQPKYEAYKAATSVLVPWSN